VFFARNSHRTFQLKHSSIIELEHPYEPQKRPRPFPGAEKKFMRSAFKEIEARHSSPSSEHQEISEVNTGINSVLHLENPRADSGATRWPRWISRRAC
jgi:hypothetical protein